MERATGAAVLALATLGLALGGCESKRPGTRFEPRAVFSPEGLDFNKDGQPDGVEIEETASGVNIYVRMPATAASATEVASVEKAIARVVICDYDGDGNLDIVFSHTGGGLAFWFIPQYTPGKPLRKQVRGVMGGSPTVESIKDLGPDTYILKGDGTGGFSSPVKL